MSIEFLDTESNDLLDTLARAHESEHLSACRRPFPQVSSLVTVVVSTVSAIMRVGIVCPYSFDEPGGVQNHVLELAHTLIDAGHYVRVLGPCSASTPGIPRFVDRGGRSIGVRYNGSVARIALGPTVSAKTRAFITDGSFDVLHIHEPNSPSYSMEALRLAEGPIVATYHASAERSLLLKAAYATFLTPLLEKIGGGIAVSDTARQWQVRQLGGDPVAIPNGIHVGAFSPYAEDTVPRRIAFVGRLDEPRKGLDILLGALQQLNCDYHLDVMGSGHLRPSTSRVTYHGRVTDEEKARLLGQADIFVAPNTGGESFGIILVEAMAAGCAVVASDIPAFPAVLGDAGLTFANGNSADLATQLHRLLDDAPLRDRLRQAGKARASRYDWSVVARQVLQVYETVADGTKVTCSTPPKRRAWRRKGEARR